MLRYGREAFIGVVAGAILGAILYIGSATPSLVAGSSIAAQLLPIGLAVSALAGSLVGVVVVFGALVALVIRDRELDATPKTRQKAAACGAAAGVVALTVGLWLIEGAPGLVQVSSLALVAVCAALGSWGAWVGVRHADARIAHASERQTSRGRASV
ncbi:hypothetical protein [Paramicrobacterium chengjingii]|uniref:Uncharacterized protein n=1 Tax=Paramicrobacterium chengjingii TaxID=2769067 RepID=A0ABX6YKX3_9MICO|nr:hypothetical protein [Microbacterium chengjingii]QPZ38987.1 hypothetical protein HCR76_02485 [Microbacterium chengjingii]